MPDTQTTTRTGIERPDWQQIADIARQVLMRAPSLAERIVATAQLCAAAKAQGHHAEVTAAAADLHALLAHQGHTLESAAVKYGVLPAATAVVMAAGDENGARAFFHRIFLQSQPPMGQIILSDVADIAAWAQGQDLPFRVIEPESIVTLDVHNHGAAPQHYIAAPFVSAVVPHGEFFSGWDFARTPEGIVLGMGSSEFYGTGARPFFHLYSELAQAVVHYWPRRAIDIHEAALFLPAPFRMHHGHWILDGLPRLAALAGNSGFKVAVPDPLPPRLSELLPLFGVKPEQIIGCKLGTRYRFRELLVAQYDSATRPSPGRIRFVADHLRKPRTLKTKASRVFITRGVPTRRPINQAEVDSTLAEFGFIAVNLAEMSNEAQRDCFSAADIVIATYGSDVIVSYFMQPGTDLIELNWNIIFDSAAASTCPFLGIGYHLLMCKPVDSGAKVVKKDTDFVVDCAALRHMIESIIEARA